MIVTCSACTTRYLVDPTLLGAGGRMVRCAKCGHSWMQRPPADMPQSLDVPPPPGTSPRPGNLPVPAVPRRRELPVATWLGLAAVVLLVLAGAIAGRQAIVGAWPYAAQLYKAAGVPVLDPAALAVRDGRMDTVTIDNQKVIVIEGQIVNTTSVPQPVPVLRAALQDVAGREVREWTFRIEQAELQPGQSLPFKTTIVDPPEDAVKWTIAPAAGG